MLPGSRLILGQDTFMLKNTLHLKTDRESVKFFGTVHKHDPQDPVFDEIERFFEKGGRPNVILIEGWERLRFTTELHRYRKELYKLKSLSRTELIRQFGDAGCGIYLALKHKLPVFSPEPSFEDELKHISSLGFDRDYVFAAYHARLIYQYRMADTGETLEEYLTPHIESFAVASGWKNYDCSFENFMAVSKRIWPSIKSFDELDDWTVVEIMAPTTSPMSTLYTPVNIVSKEEMAYRDGCILNNIVQFMRACRYVFVIYGRSHLTSLETPLKEAIYQCFEGEMEEVDRCLEGGI